MAYKKKLIEVALPLEAINRESAREKSIRHGHPSTLHLWWSRKPLATCRAVLFASLVDDPSSHPDKFPTEAAQDAERMRLHGIIERLVKWENSSNQHVLDEARAEIMKSTGGNPPPVYDPFCGGGSIPLEAQRLGLEAHGSDLNPVAVLISKALVEIPPKFSGLPPINPEAKGIEAGGYRGAAGLAEDVAYYGEWMKKEAEKKIGHLYPKVRLTDEQGGGEATVIAWLWVRTVKCPNPACGCQMPLASKFWLSTKAGKKVWAQPIVEPDGKSVRFEIKSGRGEAPEGTVNRRGAKCISCGTAVPFEYIRTEGKAGRMGSQLMAIVAEGVRGRAYLEPSAKHIRVADIPEPEGAPDTNLPDKALGFRVQQYGMVKHKHLFTNRQLTALCTFSDLIPEMRERAYNDALKRGMKDDGKSLADGGKGAKAYAEAIGVYISFILDKQADLGNSLNRWEPVAQCPRQLFARQAIPMVWDYAEGNPLGNSSGSWINQVSNSYRNMIKSLTHYDKANPGFINQVDVTRIDNNVKSIFSTDPPYYDNIGYADLADFFYVWLKKNLAKTYPDLFKTIMTPKADELVATPYRHGGDKTKAKESFEAGFSAAFAKIKEHSDIGYPTTVYYAFKQAEGDEDEESGETTIASTGWETMLEGLIQNGFMICGTWPMRSEMSSRMVAQETNALASSIVIVCRPKEESASFISRKDFMIELRKELPWALDNLIEGGIAPVDLQQAAIGPGMAVYSRYKAVLEADGSKMTVRSALQIINKELESWLTAIEGDLDKDSRFCFAWYNQFGMDEAPFGEADVLARAKNTATGRLEEKGLIKTAKGKVRITRKDELTGELKPTDDLSVWMCVQHMLKALDEKGESGVADVVDRIGPSRAEAARSLAYRLYTLSEKKKLTNEALAYNNLVSSWSDIQQKAQDMSDRPTRQATLL